MLFKNAMIINEIIISGLFRYRVCCMCILHHPLFSLFLSHSLSLPFLLIIKRETKRMLLYCAFIQSAFQSLPPIFSHSHTIMTICDKIVNIVSITIIHRRSTASKGATIYAEPNACKFNPLNVIESPENFTENKSSNTKRLKT